MLHSILLDRYWNALHCSAVRQSAAQQLLLSCWLELGFGRATGSPPQDEHTAPFPANTLGDANSNCKGDAMSIWRAAESFTKAP